MKRTLLATVLFVGLTSAATARAQSDDASTALALFEQGRALVAAGKLHDACPKFAASAKLVPKVSTLLNLADCYERDDKLASAWARFQEGAAFAEREGQSDRAALARRRADALQPRLAKLTITADARAPGFDVREDGTSVGQAVLGAAIPVDAGHHVIEASAPSKQTWSGAVDVADGQSLAIRIPALADEVAPPARAEVPSTKPAGAGKTQRTIGIVIGSVGIGLLAAGAISGALAIAAHADYEQHCGANIGAPPNVCDAQGYSGHATAALEADLATGLFVGGAVALVAGAVLFLAAPRARRITVGFGPASVLVRGEF